MIASSCETFGLNLIEGMGSRVCVISNNASCMPEVSGKDAIFFDVHDYKSLFNCVENLKQNQNLINKLTIHTCTNAKRFTRENAAKDFL